MSIQITSSNFNQLINSNKPVIVDVYTDSCVYCKSLSPLIDQLSASYEGKAIIGKMNLDQNQYASQKFGIRTLPTILIFKNGQLVDKKVGLHPYSVLEETLKRYL